MNTGYLFIPIGSIAVILYLLSHLFCSWNIYHLAVHRKIWNMFLLIAFLVSGLLGIIAVIKVNYKLEIPFYDKLLNWHVNFGIGLFFIAIFHFLWHFSYYVKIFTPKKRIKEIKSLSPALSLSQMQIIKPKLKVYVFLVGLLSAVSQLVLLREFLSVFYGNELILGVVLGIWMFSTGFGAWIGKKYEPNNQSFQIIFRLVLLNALMPLAIIAALYFLKSYIFPVGMAIGLSAMFPLITVLLLPHCLINGFLFTSIAGLYSDIEESNQIYKVYAIESTGSILGAVIFNFILVYLFNSWIILAIIQFGIISSILYLDKFGRKHSRIFISFFSLCIIISSFYFDLDNHLKSLIIKNQEILLNKDTPHGNITITKQGEQVNFYQNNKLYFDNQIIMNIEETVHFAMVQHHDPGDILIISGNYALLSKEIMKYDVHSITYVEPNRKIIKTIQQYFNADSILPEPIIYGQDPRIFLKKNSQIFDIILLNTTEPSTTQQNRFYTLEFFEILKKHCDEKTVILTSLSSTANYMSKEAVLTQSSLYNTLDTLFNQVMILPGEKNYFLASDAPLRNEIIQSIESKNIPTIYVNQYYFDTFSFQMRCSQLKENIDTGVPVNKDYKPVAFLNQIKYWLSYYNLNYRIFAAIIIILLLLSLIKQPPENIGLIAGGFTASSAEVILLLAFQTLYGNVFYMTGIIILIFMSGLVAGTLIGKRMYRNPGFDHFIRIQAFLALYSFALGLTLLLIKGIAHLVIPVYTSIFLLTFVLSFLVGNEFYIATTIRRSPIQMNAGSSYGADLLGSGFGAILVAAFIIPLLGIIQSTIILGLINLASGGYCLLRKRKFYRI